MLDADWLGAQGLRIPCALLVREV